MACHVRRRTGRGSHEEDVLESNELTRNEGTNGRVDCDER
ncbi:hypothetical protein NJ7G_1957 [Natrinema sp. J7-2]|uniref:Uncharacterized protein n=1 Tax=Natrinema gari JCM 14663 TaxID=1230459 RepID=L9Z900_9EURY|nr:hypothetical protein NJ7G_1957 [Natrinema sp. J7-2]ELY81643.1 hypothetical protein C486_06478 [Natrinema gari JCM 14663]